MRFGVMMQSTDVSMSPVRLAREAEARGYHAVYFQEHTHIPTSRLTPPPTGVEELPEPYLRALDPWATLAAVSQATETLRLGTGVALLAQHDPIALAKTIATVDHLSGGRVILGIGYGWNREEMANHGVAYATRRARVREHFLAMQELWSREVAEYHGEFVDFEPSWSWPKPVRQPRPLTLVGAAPGPTAFAHVAEFADGWMPIGGAGMRQALGELRRAMEERGRDPASLELVTYGTDPDPGKIEYYASIGVTEVVFRLPMGGSEAEVMPVLDRYTEAFLR